MQTYKVSGAKKNYLFFNPHTIIVNDSLIIKLSLIQLSSPVYGKIKINVWRFKFFLALLKHKKILKFSSLSFDPYIHVTFI